MSSRNPKALLKRYLGGQKHGPSRTVYYLEELEGTWVIDDVYFHSIFSRHHVRILKIENGTLEFKVVQSYPDGHV